MHLGPSYLLQMQGELRHSVEQSCLPDGRATLPPIVYAQVYVADVHLRLLHLEVHPLRRSPLGRNDTETTS